MAIMDQRIKKKEEEIGVGIIETEKVKESLFKLKKYFYGDFKYSDSIEKGPNPNQLIQEAISCLESAIREALIIKINSI